jgi:hypothetical protein
VGRWTCSQGIRSACGEADPLAGRQICPQGGGSAPVATWRREGGFHDDGMVEPKATMQWTRRPGRASSVAIRCGGSTDSEVG